MSRPVILAYDTVSPLGTDFEAQWARAAAGAGGVGPLTRFKPSAEFPVQIAGEVPEFDDSPYPFLRPREMALWTSPIFRHGMLVVHRALAKAGLEITSEVAPRCAITFSTAIGGLDAVLAADRAMIATGALPKPAANPNACVNMVTGKFSILTGATGPILTTVNACATGSASLIAAAMFLEAGMADVAICGAVDFPLVEPIVAGFATMNGAFKPKPGAERDLDPARASRPFSADRRGFVVSEGAACLLLATREFAERHGLAAPVELAGWAMTSDASHYVAPRLPTVARCMELALAHAGVAPGDIAAVNAHAASTKAGDLTEAQALAGVFGDRIPPVSASKSLIGHAMGASSAIETALAVEAMLQDVLLPTINWSADPEIPLDCVSEGARTLSQEFVLKNAFGFGGCNACLVLRRVA